MVQKRKRTVARQCPWMSRGMKVEDRLQVQVYEKWKRVELIFKLFLIS